jgi:hypothetical protein
MSVRTVAPCNEVELGQEERVPMRKVFVITAVALMIAGFGGWATLGTHARVAPPIGVQNYPFQDMTNAKNLPTQHYDDYSLVF